MDPKKKVLCKHRWKHENTSKQLETEGRRTRYKRIDNFVCVECAEERAISMQRLSDIKPDWY